MKYYLETNALYHISTISKDILDQSYTSIFALLEVVSGIIEENFIKRRTVLSMVRDFRLNIDHALPEEVIFNSFDIFDDFEFLEMRTEELQKLINEILASESFHQYTLSKSYNAEYGASFFKDLDERISKNFIHASVSGLKEIKRTIQQAEDDCILEFEGIRYILDTMDKMRDFLLTHPSANNAITIHALANMMHTREISTHILIEDIYDSYNGLSYIFVMMLSHFSTDSILTGKTPAKNDFADMIHLLYLKNDSTRRIVSDDKIFLSYIPSLTVTVNNLKTIPV